MVRKSWQPKIKADSYIAPMKQNRRKVWLETPQGPALVTHFFQESYSFPNLPNHYHLETRGPEICKLELLLLSFGFALKILIPEGSSPICKGKNVTQTYQEESEQRRS